MQFNGILFPGPGMAMPTNMRRVVYIPRGSLPEPAPTDGFKDVKIGSQKKRTSSGIFSCMTSSNPPSQSQASSNKLAQSLTLTNQQLPASTMQEESKGPALNNSHLIVPDYDEQAQAQAQAQALPQVLRQEPIARQVHAATSQHFPAMFIQNDTSSKLMLYFHGNAEDLALAEQQMQAIAHYCNVSVIGMEYPGYGLYQDNGSASEEKIKEDAEYLYKYCIHDMGIQESDIIVFGRSMGSGPAAWLAGTFNPAALCIMSGYTSIKGVARDQVGWLRFLVSERFVNIEMVKKAHCPTFILHGRQDEVIPFHHGQELAEAAVGEPLVFINRAQMTHNDYNLNQDLLRPLQGFFQQANIDCNVTPDKPTVSFTRDLHLQM